MATWKKIVTSGSAAELSSLTLTTGLANSELANSSVSFGGVSLALGGSDGTPAFDLSDATAYVGDSALVTVGAVNAGSITSGFTSIDIGTGTLNAGNTTVDTLTNDSSVAGSHLTGSFSGSFVGDGSNLTGVGFQIDELSNELDSGSIATGDLFAVADVNDSNEEKKIPFEDVRDAIFEDVSSDATIAIGGALTIADNAVSLAKMAGLARGKIIVGDASGDPSALAAGDNGKLLVADANGDPTWTTVSGDATLSAGALTISNDKIGNDELKQNDDITLLSLTTTNNVVVGGDLTVNGTTTTIATTNLDVEDQFIFLATGSAGSNLDAGIVVQSGSAVDTGSALYHDMSDQRWSVAKGVAKSHAGATQSPTQFVATVKTDTVNPDSTSGSYGAGEMHVNTSTGDIWIRFG